MNITEIRVRLVKKEGSKLKAVASMTIDECFVVHDIKVIQGTEGLFISMPSRKTPEGEYKDIVHPINTQTREKISEQIIAAYQKQEAEETAE
ncbi:MAG: septation regulator SpoVG [Clostridia bacterium]|nr:septation regulator SpoVG [Clostridia bacterium]